MRHAVRSAWLLLSLFALAPAAVSQQRARERFDCGLMDDLQCSEASRAELLALYALPTAESRLAAGSEMYRVFIFDAWMRHHVAITVERSPGAEPTLTLQAPPRPQGSGAQAYPPFSVPITIEDWHDVRRRAGNFDRIMVPEPVEPGAIRICSGHGPLYFVESVEGEQRGDVDDRALRRSGLGPCSEGLADAFGIEVAILAAEVLPACAALDHRGFFYTVERLRACAILSGDRLAAAEVYNLMQPVLANRRERPSAERLASLFRRAAVVGMDQGENLEPNQVWLRAVGADDPATFVVERIHAQNRGHVVVDGLLRRSLPPPDDSEMRRVEEAAVQLVWTKVHWFDFEIERLSIGTYQSVTDRCNSSARSRRAVDC